MKKKLFIFAILCMLFTSNVSANEYEDESFISDNDIAINTDINSSSLIMGENINVNSKIDGVGIIFGNNISMNSNIDYFATFGNNITFNGIVKDGIIFGNKVVLNESSSVSRDIIIFASDVSISGAINRNITVYASHVSIKDAQIAGNVKINSDTIDVEGNAAIIGHLSYNEEAEIKISDVASIGSTDTFVTVNDDENPFLNNLKSKAISMVNMLVIFALLLYFAPKLFKKISEKKKDIVKSIGFGFIFLLLVPIITLMLIVTVFGLSLSIVLIAIYLLLLYLSTMVTGYLIGDAIWEKFIKVEKRPYLIGIIGIVLIYILKLIPVVGLIISFISILIGIGTIISLYNRKKLS